MTIIEIVSTHVSALTTAGFSFIHGPKAYMNLKVDEQALPVAWLGYPIVSEDTITASGYIEPSYNLQILFANKTQLDNTPEQQQVIIQQMRTAAREFILRLQADNDNVRRVSGVRRADIQNITDVPLSGCYLTITIIPFDESSNCIT